MKLVLTPGSLPIPVGALQVEAENSDFALLPIDSISFLQI
jgi:hypothetical protein